MAANQLISKSAKLFETPLSPYLTLKQSIFFWNIIFVSFSLDFLLFAFDFDWNSKFSIFDNSYTVTILLLLSCALTFKDQIREILKKTSALRVYLRSKNLDIILILLAGLAILVEIMLRLQSILLSHILIPILIALVLIKSMLKMLKETRARETLLKNDKDFYLKSINQQNLIYCLAPAALARAAAFICFIQVTSGKDVLLPTVQYLLAFWLFFDSYPIAKQFFQSCKRCGNDVIREHSLQPQCLRCSKQEK